MYDILIKNGTVVDGSGAPAFKADVAVKDGKVDCIAPNIPGEAAEVIDATGLYVSPGFIDTHSHSDKFGIQGSDAYNYLEQGVTTQVAGNCGSGLTPTDPYNLERVKNKLKPENYALREKWCATPELFMEKAAQTPTGVNMAYFMGHDPLRSKFVGQYDVKATDQQMAQMQAMLCRAMEAGFLGYSSGLVYTPSVYGDTQELIELAKAMQPYNGIYTSHIRGEGDYVERSVREAIQIGEEAGVAVHISHLKVMGLHNEGKSEILLRLIDDANARGVVVTADQYPYTASGAALGSQLPPKYREGGWPATMKRILDPAIREKILYDIFNSPQEFESGIYHAGFDGTMISKASATPQYVGRTIGQIARDEGKAPMDVVCELLIANDNVVQGVYFNQCPTDMIRIMGHPRVFSGSDSADLTGKRKDPDTLGGRHPRGMGSMVRRLELTRDFRLRTLEESIRSVTSAPAQALHLKGQGLLKEGWDANITVFDYENLHAKASYEKPFLPNEGIEYVLVNGIVALRHGKTTGVRAGKLINNG